MTQGDLTRSITVEAQGEVAELKDNINQMIANLRETTQINAEQDWLKTNLARISGMLQGQRDLGQVTQLIMSELTPLVERPARRVLPGRAARSEPDLRLVACYGYAARAAAERDRFALGEGLVGQAARRGEADPRRATCPRTTSKITLAASARRRPRNIIVLPVDVRGAGARRHRARPRCSPFSEINRAFLDQLTETIGVVLNTIQRQHAHRGAARAVAGAGARSCRSSRRSCSAPTRSCEEKALCSAAEPRHRDQERRDRAGPRAAWRRRPSSWRSPRKYKSEFLANMSHELRTPLNSPADPLRAARRERRAATSPPSRSSSPRRSTPPATTCSR